MRRRRPDPRRLKKHRLYTYGEAALLLGVHKNTVRNWVEAGLPALTEEKPHLLRGADLREHLERRRRQRKRRLGPGEMFCLSCKEPRAPDRELVEDISGPIGPGQLRALCPCCITLMHRRISRESIPRFLDTVARRNGRSGH